MSHTLKRRTDLSAAEFKQQLKANGFTHLRQEGMFADVRERRGLTQEAARRSEIYPRLAPVMAGRRINRRATLAALLKDRAGRIARVNADAARNAERERLALAIAPRALPPPRAGLTEADAVAVMADDFITIASRNDGVTLPDLMRLGWRKEQVIDLADVARAVAYERQGGNLA